MRSFVSVLMALCISGSLAAADPCSKDVVPLLDALFSSLGHDCDSYASLFADDAKYYHQHDGYKSGSQLADNCKSYAAFCPGKRCRFLQNGEPLKVARGQSCHILVPYLWSEIPANKSNLEPHTGWEYLVTRPTRTSHLGYRIEYFAEIETSYSVAFDWAEPDQTPSVVAQSTLHLLSLPNSASRGECDAPIAPTLTRYFNDKSRAASTYRQQGDAVVLAAGGICHVAVPYSAQVGNELRTGQLVFLLRPAKDMPYLVSDVVDFPRLRTK